MKLVRGGFRRALASLDEARMGLRLLRGLPSYLHHSLDVDECRSVLRRRLARREDDFLDLLKRAVFENPQSPYLVLLRAAGCEFGDVERLVRQEGLEGALQALWRSGVYLTTDEYKGRRSAVRGTVKVEVDPPRLRNPLVAGHFWTATSGSRGRPTRIPLDLACIRDRAVDMFLALDARGGSRWRTAVWGIPCISPLLWYSSWGRAASRWFSPLDPSAPGVPPSYGRSTKAITWAGRLAGFKIPSLEPAPPDAPGPILRWMEETLRSGEVPHLWAYTSAAVRLCRGAAEAGLSLSGVQFTITGEPVTEASRAAIRAVGAQAVPDYGSADSGGSVSQGCLSPQAADDVHVFSDLNALVQPDGPPFPSGALLLTSIRATTPFVFLNVSLGDRATMSVRSCGCPMEKLGWTTHLHSIRSHEKLTAGGMTFADADVARILEEVLPRRFGGGPTDYQLVEDLTADARPRLRLLVHPSVPGLDASAVPDVFLDALGAESGTHRVMSLQWKQEGFLIVERRPPLASTSGKVLHLWSGRPGPDGGSA